MTRASPHATTDGLGEASVITNLCQSGQFDLRAAVHHDGESAGPRLGGGLLVDDSDLHPDDARCELILNRDRVTHDLQRRLGSAEYINDIDAAPHISKGRINSSSEDLLTCETGIDRAHMIASRKQELHDAVARPIGLRGSPDDGKGLHAPQYRKNIRIIEPVSRQAQRSFQSGLRLSRKAQMPSSASAIIMFLTMTSLAKP
jgi:hypothetical protein